MTLQQLLENAHLDALGQLDEEEQAAFEAAFAMAPPAVQAQIRAEQARIASMDHLLPQVEPPPYLREKVLNAVSAAMLTESAGQTEFDMRSARRVHTAWRATALGLLTACVVLTVAFVNVYTTNQAINTQVEGDAVSAAFLKTFERKHLQDVLYSPNTQRVLFEAADPSFTGRASVWVSPDWENARMFAQLPALTGQTYEVVVLDANDKPVRTLTSFLADGTAQVLSLAKLAPRTKIALVSGTQTGPRTILMTAVV
jgi:hypothetical protein